MDAAQGACVCSAGHTGLNCAVEICPNQCSYHGVCGTGGCECAAGYAGAFAGAVLQHTSCIRMCVCTSILDTYAYVQVYVSMYMYIFIHIYI